MATPGGPECAVLGRRVELDELRGVLDDLTGGRGRCVLLEGEPGSGKTALLGTLLDLAEADGAGHAVYAAVSDPAVHEVPLAVLLEALGEERAGAAAPAAEAVERVLALVDLRCAERPMVLAVDDLHAADEASLLLWGRLCAVTTRAPLLLVATVRPVPQRTEIDRLRRNLKDSRGIRLTLDPLASRHVTALAGQQLGAKPGPRLVARLESAGGNPGFVRELVDALVSARMIEIRDAVAELRDDSENPGDPLVSGIVERLGFLGAETVATLRAAALLGPELTVSDLATSLNRPAGTLVITVQETVAAGVLEPVGVRLRFRHGLLRQALIESIPSAERVALRRTAIRALMENAAPVERVAEVLIADLDAADGWETAWVAEYAQQIARRAPDVAAELFDHVLGHATVGASQCADLLEGYAALSFTLLGLGRVAESGAAIKRAESGPELPETWRARRAAYAAGTRQEAADALAEGERLGDAMTIGYALLSESSLCFRTGDLAGCAEALDRAGNAIGPHARLPDLRQLLAARRTELRSAAAYVHGRWDEARAAVDEAPNQDAVHGLAALIAVHRDDEASAARYIRSLLSADVYGPLARAAYSERANRPAEAVEHLRAIIEDQRPGLPILVRLALGTGDRLLADAAAARSKESAWCFGLIDAEPDQLSGTADRLRAAGRPLELGHVLEDQAVLYAEAGRESEAREASAEALAVYAQIGAAWDARRVSARLRSLGMRAAAGSRARQRRPDTGWDALTEAERRVASLLAQGMSNPDIAAELSLSRRTVETHVSHILMKLGVRSRREVAQVPAQD